MTQYILKIFKTKTFVLLLLFFVALTLRFSLNIARQELLFHKPFFSPIDHSDDRTASDAVWYITAAKAFLNGKGILSMDRRVVSWDPQNYFYNSGAWKQIDDNYFAHKFVPPLYPLFLAFCFYIGGFHLFAYFIPQIILSSLTCVFIYLISEEIFNKTAAFFAGLSMAFYPDLIFWASFARTETLFMFFLAFGFLLLLKGNSQKNLFLIYSSAIIFGLAFLTRVTLTIFLPILILWQAFSFSNDRKESLKVAILMALIISIIILPWGIRNYTVFGKFTVLSDESGLLTDSIENGERFKDVLINKGYTAYDGTVLKTFVFIKDNPKLFLTSCGPRFLTFWSPFTDAMKPLAKLYKGITWLIIIPAAFWGMIITQKKWKKGTEIIVIFIFCHASLHILSFVDFGLVYRYPIQPFLCIFAGYTFYQIFKHLKISCLYNWTKTS